MVKLLLSRGADANCRAKNGLTAMHLAAQEDHVPVAEVLVQHNAPIDPQTKVRYSFDVSVLILDINSNSFAIFFILIVTVKI